MSKYSSLGYGTTSLHDIFIEIYEHMIKDLSAFIQKHIYLLGYF